MPNFMILGVSLILLKHWSVAQYIPIVEPAFEDAIREGFISTNPDDVHFYVFTSLRRRAEIVYGDVESLENSGLISNEMVHLYIHGATRNISDGGCISLKTGFLKRNYKNFMCVEWGKLSTPDVNLLPLNSNFLPLEYVALYPLFIKTSKIAAQRIADFFIFLKNENYLRNFGDVHILGLSLGAQMAGDVAYRIRQETSEKIGRITGLDPSGPFHQNIIPARYKLDKNKAEFVDVIHTDAGFLGTIERVGHIDFFPNGGRTKDQPFCKNFTQIITGCGHTLALDYFERALLGEELLGCACKFSKKSAPLKQPCPKPKKCKPTTKLGFQVPKSSYGTYYVDVPENPPPGTDAGRDYRRFNFSVNSVYT